VKKTKRHVISTLLVLLFTGALLGGVTLADLEPRLGLDLRGGLSVTLTAPGGTRSDVLDKTVQILERRVNAFGVTEAEIAREGSSNISIQVPGAGNPRRLIDLIGQTAQLQFRQVLQAIPPNSPEFASATVTPGVDEASEAILPSKDGQKVRLAPADLTGDDVRRGAAVLDPQNGQWTVKLELDSKGADKWEKFTGRLACLQGEQRQIAIALDDRVESSPQVAEDVQCEKGIANGDTVITGDFDEREAKDLALVLTTGALPVKLEQSEVRTVSATLGRDSLRAGLLAGALGLGLVMLYVLLYYRSLGLQTWIGLIVFSSIIYGLIVLFGEWIGWNLTLSGIAGLIVAVGIATDSYIVFFERVKEEIHEGQTLRASIDRGFKHAFRTMRTANMVTILAAVTLYFLAVGSVKGFALALGMATALDLVITYAFTWPLAALLSRSRFFSDNAVLGMRRALEGGSKEGTWVRKVYRSEFAIDFIGRRRTWLLVSVFLLLISVGAMIPGIRGLTYGIDFKGGSVFRASISGSSAGLADRVETAVSEAGVEGAIVQIVSDRVSGRSQLQVQTEAIPDPKRRNDVIEAVAKSTDNQPSEVDADSVGQKWGAQVTTKALRGLGIFLLLVIAYMSWRLEPKMAAAGIVALLHDLVITVGVYALVGFEVTPATVIGTLTILGYSLYDTVVVFDKIRENQALASYSRKPFAEIANLSTNQVLMRSINTSLTVLLPVGSLLFVGSALLGADTLKDLALALFVGVAAGTYSSIFVATPLLSFLKEREPRYAALKTKAMRDDVARSQTPKLGGSQEERAEQVKAPVGIPSERTAGRVTSTATSPRPAQPRKKQPRSKRKKGRK